MTIKEVEAHTGLARANSRFYEGEGLLAPKRLENGYRDYSEEDARTLEKIKLLRQLQLDIDTIRRVQAGTLTLDQALFVQETKLEGDKLLIERAAAVCRELGRSGVEYAALEPKPYLAQLEGTPPSRPVLPSPPPPTPKEEAERSIPQACYHPWMRFFARTLDVALYDTGINLLYLLVFRDPGFLRFQTANLLTSIFFSVVLLFLTLAVEPLWLHFWGWTPGKWVFGLKLRDKDGNKLPLDWAFDRSKLLAWEGYGWNIPIYNLWRFWKCRQDALGGWRGSWNSEHELRYSKEERRFAGWIFAGARLALFALLSLALLWSYLPPCKGVIGVPEFARNYNHLLRVAEYGGEELDDQGRWVEPEQVPGSATINIFGDTTRYSQPKLDVHSGPGVSAVTLHMTSQDKAVGGVSRECLTLLSLCRAAGDLNLLNIRPAQRDALALLNRWEDFDQDFLGVHVSQRVEAVGYERTNAFGAVLWCEDESQPHHCEKTVTFTILPDRREGTFAPPEGTSNAP